MNEVVKLGEKLPRPLPAEQTARDVAGFINRYYARCNERTPGMSHNAHCLQVTESILPEAEKHLAQIKKMAAPASKVQIANHLALLLKSFPNGGKDGDAQIFGRMLCEDVGAQAPSIGALEAACRNLRRTCRFIPLISEVLPALAEAEERQRATINMLAGMPERREKLLAYVAEETEREAEWKRDDREQREAMARQQRAGEINSDVDLPF